MKKSLPFAVLLIAVAVAAYFWWPQPQGKAKIVAFGDSLTYGTGSERGGGYVSFLEQDLDTPIENLGVPGNTTRDALKRVDAVIAERPTVAIVLLGGNDVIKGIPAAETAKNLALISAALKSAGIKVLLLKLDILNGIWGESDLMSDSLHPNDKGYAIMARRIEPALAKLIR